MGLSFNATVALPEPHRSDPTLRFATGFALVDGVAALGRVDYLKAGLHDIGKPDSYLERQMERWRGQLASYTKFEGWPDPHGFPGVEEVARYLETNRSISFRPGILHGDYHLAFEAMRPKSFVFVKVGYSFQNRLP